MTLNIPLSTESIRQAIIRLRQAEDNLRWGLNQTIDVLVKDGSEIAQSADGDMANVTGYMPDETQGLVLATGKAAVIAEFGAGYETLNPADYFEHQPDVPVYVGSYSELVGSGEFWSHLQEDPLNGYWHFGGKRYDAVTPRQGLYKAKEHIRETATETAREVIKL